MFITLISISILEPVERLPSEAALRLKAVIDTAIDGIITIDEHGIVETINPAAARLFGYEAAEVIGRNIHMLMPSPYQEEHDGYLQRYLTTNVPHIIGYGREVRGRRKNGEVFPIRLAVSETYLADRRIFTGIIHDLSSVKQAEENVLRLNRELARKNQDLDNKVSERTEKLAAVVDQLLKTNKRLEREIQEREAMEASLLASEAELKKALGKEKELSELKSRFVSMASHEFRTPLSTILSSTELLEAFSGDNHREKKEKHIQRIKNAVHHLTSVLTDFLSLSRLEEGKVNSRPELFAVEPFVREAIDDLKVQLKTGQTLHYDGRYEHREVLLDKNALRHILCNLLANAIKYSPEGSPIKCRVSIEEDQLKIMVADQGIGIPEEDQKHLFTRFFRARNVENIKGTGLGLNIVQRYVDLLGGDIDFESQLGRGATFFVTIPIKTQQP